MAGRLSRRCRRAIAVVAAVMVLAAGLTLAFAGRPVRAQAEADDWKPCASVAATARIERVEILLALDRSGSLQNVDPNGTRRRRAVAGTRERLALLQDSVAQLLSRSGSGLDFGIETALVAFDTVAETEADFAPVGVDHPPDAAINAALGAGGDTDYGPAVEEALARFENPPNAEGEMTCRILVLFTDGILDPYDTAAGRRPDLEPRATTHVSNLLADLCATEPGMRHYRQRMEQLGVSTYVAVLKGTAFDRGAGGSHIDHLAGSSKQMILAMTGHGDSPLLGGVTAASGCESWSDVRAGKVIEISDIGDLTDELANIVGEVMLAVRQPRIDCTRSSTAEARFAGEWPHRLAVGDPTASSLCTVTPPLDGEVVLNLGGDGLGAGVEWLFDDEVEPVAVRRLTAGDAELSFNIVSSPLPQDVPVGAVADAAVEIAAIWYPERFPAWPEQPTEVPLATSLRFDVPDREAYWIERLIDCRVHQRASWADAAGGTRAEAADLCTAQAPPAGEFEMVLVPSEGNRLAWSASRAVNGGDPQPVPRGETILLVPGDAPVELGGISPILAAADVPYEEFVDEVGFTLIWRSPRGAVLAQRSVADIEIEVLRIPPPPPPCDAEAQVTAARQNPSGEWALVVDTGCMLRSPPQGDVRATVSGDVRGQAWQLVDPPPAGEGSRLTRDDVVLAPSEPPRRLFVRIGPLELADLVGEEVAFTLVANWFDGGSEPLYEWREQRTVTVYLPIPRCESPVEAVRVDVDPPGGGDPRQLVRVRNLCEIDPPPNGRLELRILDAPPAPDEPPAPDLSWRPVRDGDATDDVLIVEAGDHRVSVEAISSTLTSEWIDPFKANLDVDLIWGSARDYVSESSEVVVVEVPEDPPDLLDCSTEPPPEFGGEVPEGPLVAGTGCELLAHAAGVVVLDVEGSVAGVRWRLPEPVSLAPGDANLPILIESAGPLPNEALATAATFELVATLTRDGDDDPPAARRRRNVEVRLIPRIRIRCTESPQVVGAPIEVPEGPLTVNTGCTLLAPTDAGAVTVEVSGDVAGVPWELAEEVRLVPGDDDLPILIRSTAPLPNRRYDAVAEFALATTWLSPEGLEQSVGEQPPVGQPPPEVAAVLRARPSTGDAVLIAVALLLAGLLLGWLLLWLVGRRTNRLPRSGKYRFVRSEVRAWVKPEGGVELSGFDVASALAGGSKPLVRRRAQLRADGLTIRARVKWWNPKDLLDGGRAEVVLQDRRNRLVAVLPASGRPGCLQPSLADGAVIVALDRSPTVSRPEANQHRAQVWILIQGVGGPSTPQNAAGNLRQALAELARRLAGGAPTSGAPSQPTSGPASGAYPGPSKPPPPPKG